MRSVQCHSDQLRELQPWSLLELLSWLSSCPQWDLHHTLLHCLYQPLSLLFLPAKFLCHWDTQMRVLQCHCSQLRFLQLHSLLELLEWVHPTIQHLHDPQLHQLPQQLRLLHLRNWLLRQPFLHVFALQLDHQGLLGLL